MIASMTGFGKAELLRDDVKAAVEMFSVNNRFCEIQFRLPKFLTSLEPQIKEMILKTISRGKINYTLSWEENLPVSSYVKLNHEAADVYYNLFKELKEKYGLSGEIEIDNFVNLPDLMKVDRDEYDLEKAWEIVKEVTQIALNEFNQMRKNEGRRLAQDLKSRISKLDGTVGEIEKLSALNVQEYRKRLKNKISEVLQGQELDELRLAQEVAFMAERCDVTEECIRLRSHNQQFLSALEEGASVGKRLTFLLQEMNRETNTIGAKASHTDISKKVIFLKEETEKLREQVQNIE
ncbi:MAG: YicC/YloC family endoribonuclease [Candidatus Zixiibacteriota bacterium]